MGVLLKIKGKHSFESCLDVRIATKLCFTASGPRGLNSLIVPAEIDILG